MLQEPELQSHSQIKSKTSEPVLRVANCSRSKREGPRQSLSYHFVGGGMPRSSMLLEQKKGVDEAVQLSERSVV